VDDGELARRVIEAAPGIDREAEAELYRRFARRVRLYGRRHLRDAHLAEDLMQQVMLVTLDALRRGRLREPERIASFVLGTCRMSLIDLKRTAARRDRLLERYGEDLIPDDPREPASALDRERLIGCLERLSERERSVIVASFFDGDDAQDVGSALNVSAGNVRVIRHRALERLRGCMNADRPS
jgi:RNA polymerase sigma-70 factor (ECF subfamily)